MELLHYTLIENIESIKKNGLLCSKKDDFTKIMNDSLHMFKPNSLPDFINLNKCVFFNPYDVQSGCLCVKILSEELSQERLFVGSYARAWKVANIVYDILQKNSLSLNLDTLKALETSEHLREAASTYWRSIYPFRLYELNRQLIETCNRDMFKPMEYVTEVLYFEDVTIDKIQQILNN